MKNKNKVIAKTIRIIIMVIFLLLLLTQFVFAADNYFLMEIPKGYYIYDEGLTGDTKLIAIREDGKINFNIQVSNSQIYYEYSKKGLNDLIDVASEEMADYTVDKVDGEISNISDYPCYELNYKVIFKESNEELFIKQIYIYEDTYTYTITIGGESEEVLKEEEIQKALGSFTIENYQRNNVFKIEKEKMSPVLITILSVLAVVFVTFLIKVVITKIKNKKSTIKSIKKEKA